MEHLWRDDRQTNKNENGVNTLVSIWSLHFLFRSQYNDINIFFLTLNCHISIIISERVCFNTINI